MLTLVIEDSQVDQALAALVAANRSGEIGDGKVFVSTLGGALRLSDLKTDAEALDVSLPQTVEVKSLRWCARSSVPRGKKK